MAELCVLCGKKGIENPTKDCLTEMLRKLWIIIHPLAILTQWVMITDKQGG